MSQHATDCDDKTFLLQKLDIVQRGYSCMNLVHNLFLIKLILKQVIVNNLRSFHFFIRSFSLTFLRSFISERKIDK